MVEDLRRKPAITIIFQCNYFKSPFYTDSGGLLKIKVIFKRWKRAFYNKKFELMLMIRAIASVLTYPDGQTEWR